MGTGFITALFNLLLILGGFFTLYSFYFCVIALFGFKKAQPYPEARAATRFALVSAARNEEAVIGQLVDSLLAQNYPRELFDVYVAPNNCTDDTRGVAQAHGAKIFAPQGTIRSKGEVLAQLTDQLMASGKYDALCVFDADNLVHPDFLQQMNNAHLAGAQVAQGFRDSKNPTDTAVSTCYSVCYWMVNSFYNAGREALGLSGLVNGSGFMVSFAWLQKLGGWRTHTLTEDYEFSAQCVLAGERVRYVPGAIIYDEQPLTFYQSWKQRRRWSTGSVQGMERYLANLLRQAVRERSFVCADLALTFLTPLAQFVSVAIGAATALLGLWRIHEFQLMPLTQLLVSLAIFLGSAFVVCMLLAAFVVWRNRGERMQGTGRGIIYFAVFLLSWLPISLISLFRPQNTWEATAHTCAVALQDIGDR